MARGIEVTPIVLTATTQVFSLGGQVGNQNSSHYPAMGIPVTVSVTSVSSPTIAFSTDGGSIFGTAVTPTYSPTGQIIWVCTFPITHVKITGAISDTVTFTYQNAN
jgi:hypothetical protein